MSVSTFCRTVVLFLAIVCAPVALAAQDVSDAVINAKINSKIIADRDLSVFKVDVATNNGIVVLTGTVDSKTDADNLLNLAQTTDGVKQVDISQLVIKPSAHPVSDTMITAEIRGLFIKNKLFSNQDIALSSIGVETNNGIVYLSGTVANSLQETNAIAIAKSVSGVRGVKSSIEVDSNSGDSSDSTQSN